ncbi:MAG: C40 family peptidase [Candidatus Symbiothrix sp.]|jgi:cell wall-associated NlpC family hydrolase|nr:C40 family peptidase [Candidatus Symbiothrix sp.]
MNVKNIVFFLLLTVGISAKAQGVDPTDEQLMQAIQKARDSDIRTGKRSSLSTDNRSSLPADNHSTLPVHTGNNFPAHDGSNLSTYNGSNGSPDSLVQNILNYSAEYLGTPYHYGASGPKSFDCSGFTSFVFRNFGYKLSHGCKRQITEGQRVDIKEMKPGDLIFFTSRRSGKGKAGHVGIVVENYGDGNVRFIHASTARGVRYDELISGYYAKRYITGLRVLSENPQLPAE